MSRVIRTQIAQITQIENYLCYLCYLCSKIDNSELCNVRIAWITLKNHTNKRKAQEKP